MPGEQTRTHIVKTTSQLIRQGGYSGTAVSEMLRAADVPKGSLYYHFPGGKEQLGVEAIERSGRAVSRAIDHVLEDGSGDLTRSFMRMADVLGKNLKSTGYLDGCPLATVALEEAARSDAIGEACARVMTDWLERLTRALAAAGLNRRQARDEAVFVVSAFEGALVVARVQRDPRPLRIAAERLSARLQVLLS